MTGLLSYKFSNDPVAMAIMVNTPIVKKRNAKGFFWTFSMPPNKLMRSSIKLPTPSKMISFMWFDFDSG